MKAASLMGLLTVVGSVAAGWTGTPPTPAAAAAAALAYPGMAITQGDTLCTMGYVDPSSGLGFSAGHCAVSNDVRDDAGDVVGRVIAARNNRAGKPTSGPADQVIDYEVIRLNPAVMATDRTAPTFVRPLISDPTITPQPGMKVCHQGATTGRSCGQVAEVYDGWFTMTAGSGDLTSDHGDSGGPVYAMIPGRPQPVLLGLFRGSHGDELAAVTWADVQDYTVNAA